ncbi:hypothetical protein ACHJH3_10855 [Campylobacter sp. MOP7]|uniref:hypothetical protein n=1 Tax=Campylobacter canis TaxID=3378588 RepID=UPI00387E3A43
MELTRLYGTDLRGFSNILHEHNLSIDSVLCLVEAEIEALERHYEHILSTRDTEYFDPELAIEVQSALKRKKEKLQRYVLFVSE